MCIRDSFKDSFCVANRKTQNEKTLHADLLLAGIAQLVTLIVADKIHLHQYIRSLKPVSYTHLDVYKRQVRNISNLNTTFCSFRYINGIEMCIRDRSSSDSSLAIEYGITFSCISAKGSWKRILESTGSLSYFPKYS